MVNFGSDLVIVISFMRKTRKYILFSLGVFAALVMRSQTKIMDDRLYIYLPPFPNDSILAEFDSVPPPMEDSISFADEPEDELDSMFIGIIDTLPNGEITIDYSRLPPKVFMLLALKYGPQGEKKELSPLLIKYLKQFSPNASVGTTFSLETIARYLFMPFERRKQRNRKNALIYKEGALNPLDVQ